MMEFNQLLNILGIPYSMNSKWYEDKKKELDKLFIESAIRYNENKKKIFESCERYINHTEYETAYLDTVLYLDTNFIEICPEILDVVELINYIENDLNGSINDTSLDESYEETFKTLEDFINWIIERILFYG